MSNEEKEIASSDTLNIMKGPIPKNIMKKALPKSISNFDNFLDKSYKLVKFYATFIQGIENSNEENQTNDNNNFV